MIFAGHRTYIQHEGQKQRLRQPGTSYDASSWSRTYSRSESPNLITAGEFRMTVGMLEMYYLLTIVDFKFIVSRRRDGCIVDAGSIRGLQVDDEGSAYRVRVRSRAHMMKVDTLYGAFAAAKLVTILDVPVCRNNDERRRRFKRAGRTYTGSPHAASSTKGGQQGCRRPPYPGPRDTRSAAVYASSLLSRVSKRCPNHD